MQKMENRAEQNRTWSARIEIIFSCNDQHGYARAHWNCKCIAWAYGKCFSDGNRSKSILELLIFLFIAVFLFLALRMLSIDFKVKIWCPNIIAPKLAFKSLVVAGLFFCRWNPKSTGIFRWIMLEPSQKCCIAREIRSVYRFQWLMRLCYFSLWFLFARTRSIKRSM